MNSEQIVNLISSTDRYNFHSHTQFCDGRAPMREMARGACDAGMEIWGFSPHSPLCQPSSCNMSRESVSEYIAEAERLRGLYDGEMKILTAMEVDYMSRDFGPHIDYFQKLPLDYRIGSVHFVPNQEGVSIDCDGSARRFAEVLKDGFEGDLRYVVEKYFEQVLTMIELGAFEIIGHFDKIAGNASAVDPEIESYGWYRALMDDVISHLAGSGIIVEINTKALSDRGRFYPSTEYWRELLENRIPIVVNSDAHYPDKTDMGRKEALEQLRKIRDEFERRQ